MDPVDVNEWLAEVIGSHDFSTKKKNMQSRTNQNLERKTHTDATIQGANVQVSVPAGSQICAYRSPSGTGSGMIATIYLDDSVVNVMPGGVLKQRKHPVTMTI